MADRVVKVTLRAEVAQYAQAMEQAAAKTREVGSESEKAAQKKRDWQALGNTLLGVGGTMTALSLAVMKTGVEYNTLQQTSRAALKTLLGGAEAANAQMDKLDAFARTSPFSKAVFIRAQQQMLGFGVAAKDVVPALDAIQNAVAAMGGGNEQISALAEIMARVKSEGRLSGDALQRLGYYGIDAATIIGSRMGKTAVEIRDMASKPGGIPADQIWDPLVNGLQEKFGGAAANVKQTFSGAMDRVQAAWRDLSADLAKPLVDPNGGGALIDFLNWTADVLRAVQALPEPVKLAGGAFFAFAGFVALASGAAIKATPKIIEMWTSFKNLSGVMRGFALAGGIAVLALTALVTIVGAVAAAQADARRKAEDYAGTLEEGTNRITAATRAMVRENLSAEGSFLWFSDPSTLDKAEQFGVSLGVVQDAAMGNVDALKQLRSAQEEASEAARKSAESSGGVVRSDLETRKRLIDSVVDSVKGESSSIEEAIRLKELQARADREAAASSQSSADAYQDEAQAVQDLSSQLTGLIDTINQANGQAQTAISANAKYQSALAGLTDQVEKNGSSLDQNTESGAQNAAKLADLAGAAQNAAKAQFEQDQATMSADDAAKKYVGTLQQQRNAFVESAVKAGFNRDEVNRLADAIFKMPSKKEIDVLVDTADGQNKINNFITLNNGKRVKIHVDAVGGQSYNVGGGKIVSPNADGGIYDHKVKTFAAGGFEPGIYPYVRGGIHKFAEEHSEAYISLDPARRARSESVWLETGRRLGMSAGSAVSVQAAPVYVQNPFTGEYLLARVAGEASGVVSAHSGAVSAGLRGRRRFDG